MTDTAHTQPTVDDQLEDPTEPTDEAVLEPEVVDPEPTDDEAEPDTFPRSYVERLRKENATYREKARKAEDYARELHAARVAATGRLADPSDLDFDEANLDDLGRLNAAIDDLLDRKPHLASRRVTGAIGQGVSPAASTVDLAGIIRSRAN